VATELLVGVQVALLGGAFALFAASLSLRDLVRAIGAFALGGSLLAGAFSLLGAGFAAVLQLVVGSGLMAVLFLVAVTLTGGHETAGAR